jgi:hypothetical protein
MTSERTYVIREWGDGFWRWSCVGQHQSSEHCGIVGPPFKRDDAERLAEEHWAEAHAAAPRTVRLPSEAATHADPQVIPAENLRLIDLEDPATHSST